MRAHGHIVACVQLHEEWGNATVCPNVASVHLCGHACACMYVFESRFINV